MTIRGREGNGDETAQFLLLTAALISATVAHLSVIRKDYLMLHLGCDAVGDCYSRVFQDRQRGFDAGFVLERQ